MSLFDRRSETERRMQQLRCELKDAEKLAADKACVYVTGSFGRGEASAYSDLDLFILAKNDEDGSSRLSRLDGICIKADLIEVTRNLGIPEFTGDGQYLEQLSVCELTKTLGTPDDDATNTFTARLLLLLESRPLLETRVYDLVTAEVIAAYWEDFEDHKSDFIPAFLANDILRLWRTLCVNYESGTSRIPPEKNAKRRSKNYKLKHSRLLTCYSALLFLLALYEERRTVSPSDALTMIKLTPTQRLEWLRDSERLRSSKPLFESLLTKYESFLDSTNFEEGELIRRFQDKDARRKYSESANAFGDLMFDALGSLGNGNRFHRLLVV